MEFFKDLINRDEVFL